MPLKSLFAALKKESAWENGLGDGVKVAVIDSGIDSTHPALNGSVKGGIVFSYDGSRIATSPYEGVDSFGHGTACAGIIHDIAPKAEIHSVQVLGKELTGKADAFLKGLEWAIEKGFDVINLSLGTTNRKYTDQFFKLINDAYYKDVILVAAANNESVPSLPSILSPIIAVDAIATNDPDHFLFRSQNRIEIGARGIYIRVPWLNHGYMMMIGNSFAAPHITGLIARIRSAHPGLSQFEVTTILKSLASQAEKS